MARTTVCLEPRKARSLHAVGELMDKQVGAELSCTLVIDEFNELSASRARDGYWSPCVDAKGLVFPAVCRCSQCSWVATQRQTSSL